VSSPVEGSAVRYVCAFRGRRDSYQVPLALAEANQLDQFITDFYYPPGLDSILAFLPEGVRERFNSRRQEGIPANRVRSLLGVTAVEHARHRLGITHQRTYAALDRHYSLAARNRARRTKSNLFLYSPYAWEAFTGAYTHSPRRVLFQFHPHADFEQRLLAEDAAVNPAIELQTSDSTEGLGTNERDCWKHADLIICSSTFTKRTLLEAGADPQCCKVLPYGVHVPSPAEIEVPHERFEALFVGSGIQRKGLHHLIRAWKAAKLPPRSRLTLVCRTIDAALAKMVSGTDSIRLFRRVSEVDLTALYQSSTLFIMPSLIEGFGQVFLDALAHGCPVLGTANTCLPDLGDEEDGIFLAKMGDIESLIARLEELSHSSQRLLKLRASAERCARLFTWVRFRQQIVASLNIRRTADRIVKSRDVSYRR
jgi:glycosyltransferase involved in cell wall biosynthesis